MTDRELLEAAAKAAGYEVGEYPGGEPGILHMWTNGSPSKQEWNPLEDDGDALRLAVRLGLVIVCAMPDDKEGDRPDDQHDGCSSETGEETTNAEKRRDIVRAAAVMATEAE